MGAGSFSCAENFPPSKWNAPEISKMARNIPASQEEASKNCRKGGKIVTFPRVVLARVVLVCGPVRELATCLIFGGTRTRVFRRRQTTNRTLPFENNHDFNRHSDRYPNRYLHHHVNRHFNRQPKLERHWKDTGKATGNWTDKQMLGKRNRTETRFLHLVIAKSARYLRLRLAPRL